MKKENQNNVKTKKKEKTLGPPKPFLTWCFKREKEKV
jgi:hypothetical protein